LVERLEVGGEGGGRIGVDARLADFAALRIERAGHRVAFVIVDSGVIHGSMSVVRLLADFHSAAHVA
jgi:hypothetical protein